VSGSKNDTESIFRMVASFISNLSAVEYDSLLNGTGSIKYFDKGISSHDKEVFERLIEKVSLASSSLEMQDLLRNNTDLNSRARLIELCRFLNVEYKTKDTIGALQDRVLVYLESHKEQISNERAKQTDTNYQFSQISNQLQEIDDTDLAMRYLSEQELLRSRYNLMTLARKLDVYINKETSAEDVMKKIVDSVVGARLRSRAIRGRKGRD
jgi:hypothetical protein